jgi:hypothetical protein
VVIERALQNISEEDEYNDGIQSLEYYIENYGEGLGTIMYNEQLTILENEAG